MVSRMGISDEHASNVADVGGWFVSLDSGCARAWVVAYLSAGAAGDG